MNRKTIFISLPLCALAISGCSATGSTANDDSAQTKTYWREACGAAIRAGVVNPNGPEMKNAYEAEKTWLAEQAAQGEASPSAAQFQRSLGTAAARARIAKQAELVAQKPSKTITAEQYEAGIKSICSFQ